MSMIHETIKDCCVELNIKVCDNGYLAELQVNGMLKGQLEFKTECQLTSWVCATLDPADRDLYVHIRPRSTCHKHRALDLADKLSRRGMMIGLSAQRSVCRDQPRRLQ